MELYDFKKAIKGFRVDVHDEAVGQAQSLFDPVF